MPNLTFYGKHSKDRVLSLYLSKRVYVDEGDGLEPINGVVRLNPSFSNTMSGQLGIFCTVTCYFTYELFDFDIEMLDHTLFERTVQVYPGNESLNQIRTMRLTLPDESYFPFEFQLPSGLPPSITLNPGFVYLGRPLGITYEVSAYIGNVSSLSNHQAIRKSRVAVRFRKASYFPILRELRPLQRGEKVYFGGSKPLILTATLNQEIYYPGQPILVTVEVRNNSSHDVHRIRISAKQVVRAFVNTNDKDRFKSQVAFLESTKGCPIKKYGYFQHTFSITPRVLHKESHHVAQLGRLNMSDEPQLSPSTRPQECLKQKKGLQVRYYVNIHCQVSLAKDLIVKVPFIISGGEKREDLLREERILSSQGPNLVSIDEQVLNQMLEMGYSRGLAIEALSKNDDNVHKACEWIIATKGSEPEPGARVGNLISFQDFEQTPEEAVPPSYDSLLKTEPFTEADQFGGGASLDLYLTRACKVLANARDDVIVAQAAAANGTFEAYPFHENEVAVLISRIISSGSKIQDFISDIGGERIDLQGCYGSIHSTTNQLIMLSNISKAVASHVTNEQTQQLILTVVHDLLDKAVALFENAKVMVLFQGNIESKRRTILLADTLSKGLTALRASLPGIKEIELAVSTINFAISELTNELPTSIDPENLQQALDDLNAYASQLSLVFQTLGSASTGPTEELASVATQYRMILPALLASGKIILAGMTNPSAKVTFFNFLQGAGSANVQLLLASKEINASPNDQTLKARLDQRAREVVDTMKNLLLGSNSLQAQLKQKLSPSSSSSSQNPLFPGVLEKTPEISEIPEEFDFPSTSSAPQKQHTTRKETFDDYIVHRSGSKPTPLNVLPESEENLDQFSYHLQTAISHLEHSQKEILSARAKKNRSLDFSQSGTDLLTLDIPSPSNETLSAALVIVQLARDFLDSVQESYREMCILGRSYSFIPVFGEIPREEKEKLVGAIREFSRSFVNLLDISLFGDSPDGPSRLIICSGSSSSASAALLEACRLICSPGSPSQQVLESSAKLLIRHLTSFISSAMDSPLEGSMWAGKRENRGKGRNRERDCEMEQESPIGLKGFEFEEKGEEGREGEEGELEERERKQRREWKGKERERLVEEPKREGDEWQLEELFKESQDPFTSQTQPFMFLI